MSASATAGTPLITCHSCHLLCRLPAAAADSGLECPRCGAVLHRRKPGSIGRTWALVVAAVILYVPANLLPITRTASLGHVQEDTIMSGVIYFIQSGSWPIALVIFVASIFVPLMKLLILCYLLLSVQLRWAGRKVDRTRLYRITELVGRWSMVDVYVVTLMVALVKLGAVASLDAKPGGVYFAAVVIVTMFAAQSFDPRLIWDAEEVADERA